MLSREMEGVKVEAIVGGIAHLRAHLLFASWLVDSALRTATAQDGEDRHLCSLLFAVW